MKLLIDANILLDVLQNREDYVQDSSVIWKLCETKQASGVVPTLTFANIVYILRKELTPDKISQVLKILEIIFTFEDFSVSDLDHAADLKWKDFEDSLQYAIASRIRADYIVTRNKKDFSAGKIPAVTPTELIQLFGSET